MATEIARNAPCPCGSGKKYKKCCLSRDEAERRASTATATHHAGGVVPQGWTLLEDELDELTHRVPTLIEQRRWDEADELCARLRRDYPDVVDGIERQALVYEARGMAAEAARCYREAAAFARAHEGFEEEGIQEWLDTADRLDPPTGRP